VGTWDKGPFDNDAAADWSGQLDDAEPEDRLDLIRSTLSAAADELDYLDSHEACEAVAAAAVVASQLAGGDLIDSPYAPDFLLAGESLELERDVPPLAVRALDRIMAEESEWRDLWEDASERDRDGAFAVVARLRSALGGRP
jgi:hypothetical protein